MDNTAAWQNDNSMCHLDDQTEEIYTCPEKMDSRLIKLVLARKGTGFEEFGDRYKLFLTTVAGR